MKKRFVFTKTLTQIFVYLIEVVGISTLLAYLSTLVQKTCTTYDFIERCIMCYTIYQIMVVIILTNLNDIQKYIPENVSKYLKNNKIIFNNDFFEILKYKIISMNENDLKEILGLTPGSVTLLGILNDSERKVSVYIDKYFLKGKGIIGVHPLKNDATVWLKTNDLINILKEHGNEVNIIEI